jgi:hypothetical protein
VHIAIQALADIAQNGTSEAAPNSAPLHGIGQGAATRVEDNYRLLAARVPLLTDLDELRWMAGIVILASVCVWDQKRPCSNFRTA